MRVAAVALSILSAQSTNTAQLHAPRTAIALPVSAKVLAAALGLPSSDASQLLVNAVRLVYSPSDDHERQRAAARAFAQLLDQPSSGAADVAPLPLDASIWRDVILDAQIPDNRLVAAILRDRSAALLYLGLSALDDETLAWLGSHTEILRYLRKYPGTFAMFGRSVRIRAGRIAEPGGSDGEALWDSLIGVDAGRPAEFIERVFSGEGRLAFFYDTVMHLDEAHRRFALGLYLPPSSRRDSLRTLLRAFEIAAPAWRIEDRPFWKPPIDGAMLLSTVAVLRAGGAAPPADRRIWERVFHGDDLADVPFHYLSTLEIEQAPGSFTVDASWLAARILTVPYGVGRRRLDQFLFAQRVFGGHGDADPALVATSLRGYAAFPALMIALERTGIAAPKTFAGAAAHAAGLGAIEPLPIRRTSIAEFQSALVLIQRFALSGALDIAQADRLIVSLSSLDVSAGDGYGSRFSRWFHDELVNMLPSTGERSIESTVLGALAGVSARSVAAQQVTWEGRTYFVDPAAAELRRLRLVRERQGSMSLDDALAAAFGHAETRRTHAALSSEAALAEALVTVVYAVYLGDPSGLAVTSRNVAARHDFALMPLNSAAAWRLPVEDFDRRTAWRVRGSLLGLETALSGLALRRVNEADMPAEPKVGPQDRQTLMLTVALLNPPALSDESRDAIAAAIGRGRARVQALAGNPMAVGDVARDAALSEWRGRALEWALARGADEMASRFSLLELLWLGLPSGDIRPAWDAWGAATLPLTGCLCLQMPRPHDWEAEAGHASALLGTRAADVSLRMAEALAAFKLPATLVPSLAGYAMQDVLDHAQLSHIDDWDEFGRAARELPPDRLSDYIAALTAGGPLVPVVKDER
jgi:hypothetical protein